MVTCSQCGAEYPRKPSKCACGYRFSAADSVPLTPALDRQCKFTVGLDRCPAHNGGDGFCDWHSQRQDQRGPSVVNYLRAHGVPQSPPDWREVFVLCSYAGMRMEECRAYHDRFKKVYLSIPYSLASVREAYEAMQSQMLGWKKAMNGQRQPAEVQMPRFASP